MSCQRAALACGSGCFLSMLAELGFIGTIGENDEVPVEPESDSGDEEEEVGAGRGRSCGRERLGTSCGPQALLSVLRCFTQAVRSPTPQTKSVLLPAQSGTHARVYPSSLPGCSSDARRWGCNLDKVALR